MTDKAGVKEAMFWETKDDASGTVQCRLCAHNCTIKPGKRGICGVRENRDGTLYTLIYRLGGSGQADPIEKKPLYHFYPKSMVTSFGTVGCNFHCKHCQNYSTSQARPDSSPYLSTIDFTDLADCSGFFGRKKCRGVAWTYNEPTIWYETTYDGSIAAKEQGLYTVYVTNGFMNAEPLRTLAPYLDAMNIDVKSFSDRFYRTIANGRLQPVLDTCELAHELGIHLELTYLLIPGYNDDEDEIGAFAQWVVETLGSDVPVHYSAFHPTYKLRDVPSTPITTMEHAHELTGAAGVDHVYLGNVRHRFENTFCPNCGETIITRYGYRTTIHYTDGHSCPNCGHPIAIIDD